MYLKIFNKNYINVELLKTYIKKNYDDYKKLKINKETYE